MPNSKNMNENNKIKRILPIVGIISLLVMSVFLSACQINDGSKISAPEYAGGLTMLDSSVPTTQEMKKFNNVEELKKFLQERAASGQSYGQNNYYGSAIKTTRSVFSKGIAMETLSMADSAAPTAAGSMAGSNGALGADDFSQTNIQVEGVDEADYVKNDNRYIYMIADNKLIIVDAYDAKNAQIISTTKINTAEEGDYYNSATGREIFINGDKLLLFVEKNERAYYFERYDIRPMQTYKQKTYALVYDITDRKNPTLVETFSLSGSYFQSRMIGSKVYAVTRDNVYDGVYINEPVVKEIISAKANTENTGSIAASPKIVRPEIYYFDNPEENYQFNTITSLDIKSNELIESKTFMLGYSNTLMVSENNIYIAYQKQTYWMPWWRPRQAYDKERFDSVVLPNLPADLKSDIDAINSKDLSDEEKWKQISERLSKFYEGATNEKDFEEKYKENFENIQKALDEYDAKKALENTKTIIQKIAIKDGKIEYQAKGEVYGNLLNQFSLDEYNGNLRVATTVNIWAGGSTQYNNVFVLDSDMKTIGKLEKLAEEERIYSTRFLGDKLYMVTFKQVDPFFVIDLSDATNPKVLGYLKIPGFSDYLHPYDATHIIGVGKETAESEWGGITTKGLKVALFDVSDFANPKLVDQVIIGDKGTESPALRDHKAFLFSKTKNVLVLPVSEVTQREKLSEYRYRMNIWNGAYVFNVTTDGFKQLGKVKHSSSSSEWFDWWNDASVQRSLYMDSNLYTISNKYIKINDLGNDLNELNTVKLPTQSDNIIPIPFVETAVGVVKEAI